MKPSDEPPRCLSFEISVHQGKRGELAMSVRETGSKVTRILRRPSKKSPKPKR